MLGEPANRLRDAIVTGNLLIVKRLLRRYPNLLTNMDPKNGWSSLHYASFYGRYLICVFLIQLGHDKHEILKTFKGNTCVHLALMNGHEQTTHLLLQHFPRFINQQGEFGRTPAHIACIHDYFKCLSLLIGVGADLSLPDDKGDTPLHTCLEYGSIECMKMLIREGHLTSDEQKDNYSWKPSEVAETFEFAKAYAKVRKDSKSVDPAVTPTYQKFRIPVMDSKAVLDSGPSPVLTMNSQFMSSSHNMGTPPPKLPDITASRRPSITNTSFIPLASSKRSSASTFNISEHGNDIISKKENSPEIKSDRELGNTISELKSSSSNTFNSEKVLNNKNILQNLSDDNQLTNKETSKVNLLPTRRMSLLSIPISKLRNTTDSSI